ncbi:MAG: hypothetical protein RI985_1657 [Chloroflexota bacterium]
MVCYIVPTSMELSMTPALEVRNLTKRFPGIIANDAVNFTLEKGEIHALLGETVPANRRS